MNTFLHIQSRPSQAHSVGRTYPGDSARSKQLVPIQPRTKNRGRFGQGRRVVADSARAECLENECHVANSLGLRLCLFCLGPQLIAQNIR